MMPLTRQPETISSIVSAGVTRGAGPGQMAARFFAPFALPVSKTWQKSAIFGIFLIIFTPCRPLPTFSAANVGKIEEFCTGKKDVTYMNVRNRLKLETQCWK